MVVWKYKTPVIMTASQRAEVLVQTHSISNTTWEKPKPIQTQKTSLSFKLSKSLNFSLDWNLSEQLGKNPFLSVFSKCQFPFHPIVANWAEITPIYLCLCSSITASVSAALGMLLAYWLILLQSQEGKHPNRISERERKLPSSIKKLRSFLCQVMIN